MVASDNSFEVQDVDKTYFVNLLDRICECGAFKISGIPYKHAALGILYRRDKFENYCDVAFKIEPYLKTYSGMIHPIPVGKDSLDMPDVIPAGLIPPPLRRAPGRPRKNRTRGPHEPAPSSQSKRSTTLKCSICLASGQNKRTCQRGLVKAKMGAISAPNHVYNLFYLN
ncbi:hypothetical protein ACH5RR_011680 [Cinchona calisaya]|uniref:Zinc finger PMZ-type domain-containing protein n=1 Tax=Cinchona calisaya TaxID=153742 RepID=A0ABD3A5L5_9GENT